MSAIEAAVDCLKRNSAFLDFTIGDFTQAEMLARPHPKANHVTWQIGHLIGAEARMVNAAAPGAVPLPPASFADKFKKDTASIDDPAFFPTKEELLAAFKTGREATVAWASTLKEADLAHPLPEPVSRFAPTTGHLLMSIPQHVAMHVGQFQVIRRKLGKPILM
jgi:hypothetical protein